MFLRNIVKPNIPFLDFWCRGQLTLIFSLRSSYVRRVQFAGLEPAASEPTSDSSSLLEFIEDHFHKKKQQISYHLYLLNSLNIIFKRRSSKWEIFYETYTPQQATRGCNVYPSRSCHMFSVFSLRKFVTSHFCRTWKSDKRAVHAKDRNSWLLAFAEHEKVIRERSIPLTPNYFLLF